MGCCWAQRREATTGFLADLAVDLAVDFEVRWATGLVVDVGLAVGALDAVDLVRFFAVDLDLVADLAAGVSWAGRLRAATSKVTMRKRKR